MLQRGTHRKCTDNKNASEKNELSFEKPGKERREKIGFNCHKLREGTIYIISTCALGQYVWLCTPVAYSLHWHSKWLCWLCVPIVFPSLFFPCVCVNSSSSSNCATTTSSVDNQTVSWRTKEEEEEEEAFWSKASCEPLCRSVCVLTKCIINDCLYCLSAGAGDDDDDDCFNDYRGNATGTDGEEICCQQTLPKTHTHFHRHIPLISTLHTHTHGFISSSLQSSNLAVSTPFLWPGRNSSSSEFHCNEMKTDTLAFAPAVRLGTLLEHIKFVWHTYCQAYSTVSDSFCIIRRVADIPAPLSPPSLWHSHFLCR